MAGQPVSLTVAVSGAGPLEYKWVRNGQVIPGATGATLSLAAATQADRGWYLVTVSNTSGRATSVCAVEVGAANTTVVTWGELPAPPADLGPVLKLTAGSTGVLALRPDGTVGGWSTYASWASSLPTGLSQVVAVAGGKSNLALKADGRVVGWGTNTPPPGLTNVVAIANSDVHSLALKADGTVVAWGDNYFGQSLVPAGLRDVVAVAAGGWASLALLADGTLVGWGDASVPSDVTGVVAIALSNQALALKADGTVVAWMRNNPASVIRPASASGAVAIATGNSRNLALKADGTVVPFGWPTEGTLTLPVSLSAVSDVTTEWTFSAALVAKTPPLIQAPPVGRTATAGAYVTFSVSATGPIPVTYQWKRNGGNVANGGAISGATSATLVLDGVTPADTGSYTVVVTNASGSVTSTPAALVVNAPPTIVSRPRSRLATVGAAISFSITATDSDPITYQWRRNGQPITGATTATLNLPSVAMSDRGYYEVVVSNGGAATTSVFHLGVSTSSTTGVTIVPLGQPFNAYGQTTIPAGLTNVVEVAAGTAHTVALKSDGTITVFGANNFGVTSVPAGLTDVVAVAASDYSTFALKADGRVASWGSYFENPPHAQIGALRGVVTIAARRTNFVALKTDGTVFSLLGTVPAELSGVVAIAAGESHAVALRADGTVVTWAADNSTPVEPPANLAGVVGISAGRGYCLALKSDGSIVVWGVVDPRLATVPPASTATVALEAAASFSLVLRADGTVVGWGSVNDALAADLAKVGGAIAVAGAEIHALALIAAGTPVITRQPVAQVASVGDTITLSIAVSGAPLPTVQWRRNGVEIAGATAPTLTLTGIQSANAGAYSAVVTNPAGSVTSTAATLTVVPPVAISARSLSQLVAAGQPANFSVTAAGNGSLTYQWRRNGENISGATGATFTVASVTAADRGRYEVLVTDAIGATARSVSYLTVASGPGSVIAWGQNSRMSEEVARLTDVVALSIDSSVGMVLRADGTVATIGGGSTPPAGFNHVVAIAQGGYHRIALKDDGTISVWGSGGYSETAVPAGLNNVVAIAAAGYNSLALRADGTVVRWGYDSSSNLTVPAGLNNVVAIAVGAAGDLVLRADGTQVKWGSGGSEIRPAVSPGVVAIVTDGGSTVARLSDGTLRTWGMVPLPPEGLSGVRAMSVSSYLGLVVRSDYSLTAWGGDAYGALPVPAGLGKVFDVAARQGAVYVLTDAAPATPVITTPPVSQVAEAGQDVVLSVAASGTPTFSYQWKKGELGVGTNSPTLTLSRVEPATAGTYTVTVSNSLGSATASAMLTVSTTAVSASAAAVVGGSVSLSVNAVGALSYQWRYRGSLIPGATDATLTLNSLSRGQNGDYDVVLTTAGGPRVAQSYTLDVRPATMPDIYVADPSFALRLEREGAGGILAALKLPDGKFLVGGDFTRLGATPRLFLARLNADGTLDSTYIPPVLNAPVRVIVAGTEGKIYVGGDFAFVEAKRSGGLVRLAADLTVDPSFAVGQGFDGPVYALAAQSNGKVLVGGEFFYYGAVGKQSLVRLNADATIDDTLTYYNSIGPVRVIQRRADGKFWIAGGRTGDGESISSSGYVLRLLADGPQDTTFGPSYNNGFVDIGTLIKSLTELPDGKLLVAGGGRFSGGAILKRLNPAGDTDSTFAFTALSSVSVDAVVALADGKVFVSGEGVPFTRLTSTGAVDATSPAMAFATARFATVTTESDGSWRWWGNSAATTEATPITGSVVMEASGSGFRPVTGSVPRAIASVYDAQHVSSNRILLRGSFTHVNDAPRAGLVRLLSDGGVDGSFSPAPGLALSDTGRIAPRGDGAVLVHNGTHLIRLTAEGSLDPTFTPLRYAPSALTQLRNGQILIGNGGGGGIFGTGFGARRLSAAGVIDPAFVINPNGPLSDFVEEASGRIVIGGAFGNFNGQSVESLVRIMSDGAFDRSYSGDGRNRLIPASGDAMYVLSPRTNFAYVRRLLPSGLDASFNLESSSNTYGPAYALLPLPEGKVLRSSLPRADALNIPGWLLGRHLTTGALDPAFQVGGLDRLTTKIERMLMQDDGNLWLFGQNLSVSGVPQLGAMRLAAGVQVAVTTPPVAVRSVPGGTATFSVGATGSGPLTYQWSRNGLVLPGATAATLTFSNLTTAEVGSYTVTVTSPFGTITPPAVSLSGTGTPPLITTQPVAQLTAAGNPASFSVSLLFASPTFTYQWYRAGVPLAGATGSTFTIPAASRAEAGLYNVVIANGLSLATSQAARLDVAPSSYPNALQVDPSFNPRFEIEGGSINAIVPDGSGRFLVSGDFTRINGVLRPCLARVDADFQVDATFVPPADFADMANTFGEIGVTRVHTVLADGRILVTRPLPRSGAYPYRNTVVRLLADGRVDSSFTASTEPLNITRLAVQPDGKVIVVGVSISLDPPAGKRHVYRLNGDGSLDAAYAPQFLLNSSTVAAPNVVVVQPNGRALFAGGFTSVNGTSVASSALVRLTADGVVDATFQVTGVNYANVTSASALPDGRLLVGGSFGLASGTAQMGRLGVNGAWETALLADSTAGSISRIVVQADGKLWAAWSYSYGFSVWRISAAGTVEQKFTSNQMNNVWAFAPAGSDRVLATTSGVLPSPIGAVRFAANGTADIPAARIETVTGVSAAVALPGGKLLTAGAFTRVNGVPNRGLARLNLDGTLDASFAPSAGFDLPPATLYPLANGKLLVSGAFTSFGGAPVSRLVRLTADGALDLVYQGYWNDNLAVLPDGRVLSGGQVALRTDGSVDPSYKPTLTNIVAGVPLTDGKVIAATSNNVARLLATGSTERTASFSGAIVQQITSVAVQPDGKIMAGGRTFFLINSSAIEVPLAIRLNADLTRDTTFATNGLARPMGTTSAYRGAQALPQEDGRVLMNDYYGFSRLKADGTLDPSFVLTNVSIIQPAYNIARSALAMLVLDDGKLLLADQAMDVDGLRRMGLVRLMDAAMPVLTVQPVAQTVFASEAVSFSVAASGTGPLTYQWLKNGVVIPSATTATYTVASASATDTGSYSVLVTSGSNTVRSSGASLVVNPASAPTISRQPRDRSATVGQTVGFEVVAYGQPLPTYEWRKNGNSLVGKTESSLTLAALTEEDAGLYSVVVTNGVGAATSSGARLTLFPAGMSATHTTAVASAQAGGIVTISNTFTYSGTAPTLDWQVLLPVGWTIVTTTGDGAATAKPATGTADLAEWRWTALPPSPVTFTYTLASPAAARGDYEISALVTVQSTGEPLPLLAQPDPLVIRQRHTADTDGDGRLSLVELTRVIELYGTRYGSERTGCYRPSISATEDGYAPDYQRSGPATMPHFHSADSDHDGQISLLELTRVIQLYNTRSGSVRTGAYHPRSDTEDGFDVGW